jgi:hypothetical protein
MATEYTEHTEMFCAVTGSTVMFTVIAETSLSAAILLSVYSVCSVAISL